MGESARGPLPVAEHIVGRFNFMARAFGDKPTRQFIESPMILSGRHPEAEHRTNLGLIAVTFAAEIAFREGGFLNKISKWTESPQILLNFQEPLHYLGNSPEFSDSLWLSVAACAFTDSVRMVSDTEAAEFVETMSEPIDLIEKQYRPS